MNELESGNFFSRRFDPIIEKRHNVGSEMYNAPEIWDNDITMHEVEKKMQAEQGKGGDKVFEYSDLDGQLRSLSLYPKYDGMKADVFSCGATLFMVHMQAPPFRKAVMTDPYFKRLASAMKQNFWKIFKNITFNSCFKDIIEKTLAKYPSARHDLDQIKDSVFFN